MRYGIIDVWMTEKRVKCKDYGLKCLVCLYWNKYSRYCTKYKIWSETHD